MRVQTHAAGATASRSRMPCGSFALILSLMGAPFAAVAETADTIVAPPPLGTSIGPGALADWEDDSPVMFEAPVYQYYLAGPRIGATFAQNTVRSQFGWHFENQASPGSRGPWFIVEKIWLVAGVENNQFLPSGTLVFGMRTPSGFEFGVGPNVGLGPLGFRSAVVIAAGQTVRFGGIQVPINIALATAKGGENRITLITGWAIREPNERTQSPRKPPGTGRLLRDRDGEES